MKRVVLECRGRMANNILCWANAVHVIEQLGFKDWLIVVHYPELSRATMPGAQVEMMDIASLPRVTREDLANQAGDCLWVWEDIYANFPEPAVMKRIIKTLQFPPEFYDYKHVGPLVGVHVRYGDYVSVDPANPPAEMPPFIRASNSYFLDAINACREKSPACMFFVASDATYEELEFLRLPYVRFGGRCVPLADLFVLSQCCLIIGSNSTFSHVAAMYGDVPLTTPAMSDAEIQAVIKATL